MRAAILTLKQAYIFTMFSFTTSDTYLFSFQELLDLLRKLNIRIYKKKSNFLTPRLFPCRNPHRPGTKKKNKLNSSGFRHFNCASFRNWQTTGGGDKNQLAHKAVLIGDISDGERPSVLVEGPSLFYSRLLGALPS